MKKLLLLCFILISIKCISQNNTEVLTTIKVLTQLSETAQRKGNKSSVLIYQNTFYSIWKTNPNLHNSNTFQKALKFFSSVKKKNEKTIKERCYSMNGKISINGEVLSNNIVVITPSGGWANNEVPSLFFENFDNGLISTSDIEYISLINSINDKNIKFNPTQNQLNFIINYQKNIEKKTYDNIVNEINTDNLGLTENNIIDYSFLLKNKILQDAIFLIDEQNRLNSNLNKKELKTYDKLIKSIENIEKSKTLPNTLYK